MNAVARAKLALGVEKDSELARSLEVSTSVIPGYHKRGVVPLEQCIKIAEQTGVSLDWLILGKGPAPLKAEAGNPGQSVMDYVWADRARRWAAEGREQPDVVWVPLYNVAASAGHGNFFDQENIVQFIPFNRRWVLEEGLYPDKLECVSIAGDSMVPGLNNTDITLINRAKTQGDGVFVLQLAGAVRVKRLQWLADGRLRISSDNPIYETEYLKLDELADNFAIIGHCHTKIGRVI